MPEVGCSSFRGLLLLAVLLHFPVALTACASERAHQNFKNIMQLEVGKSIDYPHLTRNEYPTRRVATRTLPNGNTEEEFRAGEGLKCRVFFEIDNKSQKIVAWRYEGTDQICAIRP